MSMESDLTLVNAFQDFLATDANKVKVGSLLGLVNVQQQQQVYSLFHTYMHKLLNYDMLR